MKQYKGYYIDHIIFNNTEEIDNFLKEQALNSYKLACELFVNNSTMANSIYCDEKAQRLVNEFGYTWEQVEELEIEYMKQSA